MNEYFVNVNSQSNGDHEVHKAGCNWMPKYPASLGFHYDCQSALKAARVVFSRADGCAFCSPLCHKR